jgi:hypothetical protein
MPTTRAFLDTRFSFGTAQIFVTVSPGDAFNKPPLGNPPAGPPRALEETHERSAFDRLSERTSRLGTSTHPAVDAFPTTRRSV